MRRFLSFAALFGVALVLGCQDVGTGPEAPTPLFVKVPTTGSSTYTVTHSGDVTTDPSPITGRKGVGKKSRQVDVGGHGSTDAIVFSDPFADGLGDSLGRCFPRTAANNPTNPLKFSGALRPDKQNPSKIIGQYFFNAFGTDGTTEFKYELLLTGTLTGDPFPPDPTKLSTVTWDGAGAAEMKTEGKGKGSKGKNKGTACVGTVEVIGSVTILGV
ncbi:MAG: hypothetical protein IH968_17575 [Gemmatimonadetes bacterium]|nr:hypothetical protein [Gemmatimonadota bacterium]